MKKTTIVIGESSSIPLEIAEKYNMHLVPFVMEWKEEANIEGKTIFEKMRNAKKNGLKTYPKTSQPSIGVYKKIFEEILSTGQEVLCLTISSKISGTYNSAFQARKMLKEELQNKVFIFDTMNADATEALLGIKAAELVAQGKTAEEIYNSLDNSKIHVFGMIESPRWLETGGRINSTIASILENAQKLGLRPILGIKDGLIKPTTVKMKAKDTAEALLKEVQGLKNPKLKIAITHADNLEEALKLKTLIEDNFPESTIEFISLISLVIGAHVGPGSLLVCTLED
ncbi:MAG: DegV family protein [Candidatus Pacebacteria bacterium]|jgi:DegV family protein with EDD domain|nr:DegV family protein [Candidatus Paceibacterota bacterium]MDD5013193.1 DegV family protein [Candidatus Paceibacterota bacterium]MDD5752665.1 DegV family protein [Candidatus Paceibacterota bacterium]